MASVSVVPPTGMSVSVIACKCQLDYWVRRGRERSQVYACICGKAEQQVETGDQRQEGNSSQLPSEYASLSMSERRCTPAPGVALQAQGTSMSLYQQQGRPGSRGQCLIQLQEGFTLCTNIDRYICLIYVYIHLFISH